MSLPNTFILHLTGGERSLTLLITEFRKGGEADEVDVSPCNTLLSVRLNTLVLSRTLNGSSMVKKSPVKLNKRFKSRRLAAGFFLFSVHDASKLMPVDPYKWNILL
jgi:hypothetical protein